MLKKDIVIVPTFSRPEMLWFCLERLAACSEIKRMDVWVCVDAHTDISSAPPMAEIYQVLERFASLPITPIWRNRHPYQGNTFNVMEAYRQAYESPAARYVYLVEDDVMVDKDFFAWHQLAQSTGRWFCSIASRCLKSGTIDQGFIVSRGYASIGVCFKRENLASVILHAKVDYYSNLGGYTAKLINDGRANQFTEQDGLIERVIVKERGFTIFPEVPRCHHIGWYGYHRWNHSRPAGNLTERYNYVKRMATDPVALKGICPSVIDVEAVTQ